MISFYEGARPPHGQRGKRKRSPPAAVSFPGAGDGTAATMGPVRPGSQPLSSSSNNTGTAAMLKLRPGYTSREGAQDGGVPLSPTQVHAVAQSAATRCLNNPFPGQRSSASREQPVRTGLSSQFYRLELVVAPPLHRDWRRGPFWKCYFLSLSGRDGRNKDGGIGSGRQQKVREGRGIS